MTRSSESVYLGLKRAEIDFVTSIPCINLRELLSTIESDEEITYIPATREEEGVGLCAGAYLGGMSPAMLMQNSGLGNSINALASLDFLYGIPLLIVISHRGGVGESIVAQVPMGRLTEPLLNAMGVSWLKPETPEEAEWAIVESWSMARSESRPAAVLLDIEFWRQG